MVVMLEVPLSLASMLLHGNDLWWSYLHLPSNPNRLVITNSARNQGVLELGRMGRVAVFFADESVKVRRGQERRDCPLP